jgi:DNA-binding response OmpR family regulator
VEWVKTGTNAYDHTIMAKYDVLILDWMMPGKSGVEVCRQLRNEGYSGAILMLTARDSVHDRVEGLDSDADDYLVKPFEFAELYARIRALSRRNYAPRLTLLYSGLLIVFLILFMVTVYSLLYMVIYKKEEYQIQKIADQELGLIKNYVRQAGRMHPADIANQEVVVIGEEQFFYYVLDPNGHFIFGDEVVQPLRPSLWLLGQSHIGTMS